MGKPKSRRIAYVGRIIPSVSETFVVREIAALRDLGLPIQVFSVHAFNPAIVHPEAPGLASEAEILTCPSNPMFWLAHVYFLSRFPGRYFRCIKDYVATAESSRAARLRCLHTKLRPRLNYSNMQPPDQKGGAYAQENQSTK